MNPIATTLILAGVAASISSAGQGLISPFAAPATKLEFSEATPENFPYSTFLFPDPRGERSISFEEFGKFRFCTKDLNGDGHAEWLVALKEEFPHGSETLYYFVVRDSQLSYLLRTRDPYVTIIPRAKTYADIESWWKEGEFSHRQRWTFDQEIGRHVRLWVEFYRNDVLVETKIDRRAESGR